MGGQGDELDAFAAAEEFGAGIGDFGAAAQVEAGDFPLAFGSEAIGETGGILAPDGIHEMAVELADAAFGDDEIVHSGGLSACLMGAG